MKRYGAQRKSSLTERRLSWEKHPECAAEQEKLLAVLYAQESQIDRGFGDLWMSWHDCKDSATRPEFLKKGSTWGNWLYPPRAEHCSAASMSFWSRLPHALENRITTPPPLCGSILEPSRPPTMGLPEKNYPTSQEIGCCFFFSIWVCHFDGITRCCLGPGGFKDVFVFFTPDHWWNDPFFQGFSRTTQVKEALCTALGVDPESWESEDEIFGGCSFNLPFRELTYPIKNHFWRWFSELPKVGYVNSLEGRWISVNKNETWKQLHSGKLT